MLIGIGFITAGEFAYQKEKRARKAAESKAWDDAIAEVSKEKVIKEPSKDDIPFATD